MFRLQVWPKLLGRRVAGGNVELAGAFATYARLPHRQKVTPGLDPTAG